MAHFKTAFLLAASLALVGCSSVPEAPLDLSQRGRDLCLVDNAQVRAEMFLSIRRALLDKGYRVTRVEKNDSETLRYCHQILYYEATYGSALSQSALRYMKLELHHREAYNNVFTVQWNDRSEKPTLFDQVEDPSIRVRSLVDRLFPGEIPWQ